MEASPPPATSGPPDQTDHRIGIVLAIEAVVALLLGLLLAAAAVQPTAGRTSGAATSLATYGGLLLVCAVILGVGARRLLNHHEVPSAAPPATLVTWDWRDVLFGMAGSFVLFICASTAAAVITQAAFGLTATSTGPLQAIAATLDQLASYLGMATSVWMFVRWRHRSGMRALGWRRPQRWSPLLLSPVIAIGVVAIADFLLAPINTYLLPFAPSTQCKEVVQQYGGSSATAIALAVVTICVMAPLFEETVFRGFVYGGLRRRLGVSGAAAVSGAVFAAYHLQPDLLLPLFFLGVVLAIIYEESGAIWPSMVVHALFNLPGVLLFLTATHC